METHCELNTEEFLFEVDFFKYSDELLNPVTDRAGVV